jgi:hypothetical protein
MKLYWWFCVGVGLDVAFSTLFPLTYNGVTRRGLDAAAALDVRMATRLDGRDPFEVYADELFPNLRLKKGGV